MKRVALVLLGLALTACGTEVAQERAAPVPEPEPSRAVVAPAGPAVSAGRASEGVVQPLLDGLAVQGVYAYANRAANDCGQAAVATALTTTGAWERPDHGGADRQQELMTATPPDVIGGVWGSSPRLVQQMLGASAAVKGVDGLRGALADGKPVVVLLDLGPLGRGRGAHWTVVVGMDETHVQVTNLGGGLVERVAFERAWNGLVPTVAGMRSTGLVPA